VVATLRAIEDAPGPVETGLIASCHRLVHREDVLHPTDRLEEGLHLRGDAVVPGLQGEEQVGPAHLGVRDPAQPEALVDLAQQLDVRGARQELEVERPLRAMPARVRRGDRRRLGVGHHSGREQRHDGRRVRRHVRLVHPVPGLDLLERPGQTLGHEVEEGRRVDRLEPEPVDVGPHERVEPLPAHRPLQGDEEHRSLVVRDPAEDVVRVGGRGQVGGERGEVGSLLLVEPIEVPIQLEHGQHHVEFRPVSPVEGFVDPPLEVHRPPFVEPEVAPARVGDEVAGPRVRQLVPDDRDQGAIARDEGGGQEGQAGVLHPAVGEGGREHQHVEAVPVVGTGQRLRGVDHATDVLELLGRRLDHLGFGVHSAAVGDVALGDVADRERDQVGRDSVLHHPALGGDVLIFLSPDRRRPHERAQRLGDSDLGIEGEADLGAVLAGDIAPRVDGLALTEQIRVTLPLGQLGGEPLQARRHGAGLVVDPDDLLGRDDEGEGTADHRIRLLHLREVHQVVVAVPHGLDRQVTLVEHRLAFGVEVEASDTLERAAVEVDRDAPVEVYHLRLVRPVVRVGILVKVPFAHGGSFLSILLDLNEPSEFLFAGSETLVKNE